MLLGPAALLTVVMVIYSGEWQATAAPALHHDAPTPRPTLSQKKLRFPHGWRLSLGRAPTPAVVPDVRPEFAREMRSLRGAILAAAERHNRPALSQMSDHDFAVLIALLLYNENFGWPEDQIPPLQALTPLYEDLQTQVNEVGGANLTVRPAKLRPSVALEILRHEVPVPAPTLVITQPVLVAGSRIDIAAYPSLSALYTAITQEITQPALAVEYLAANLERGLYRAQFEGVPVTWRTLAAWHNRGIVSPQDIRDDPHVHNYIRRASAYFATARRLIDVPDRPPDLSRAFHSE